MTTTTRFFLSLLLCLIVNFAFAQHSKGMHVNNFKTILGNTAAEDELLTFAQTHQFNYLLLYNLYHIQQNIYDFTNPAEAEPLANFIVKARTQYGITEIGAVGETFKSFAKIEAYNNHRADQPLEQFDVLHLEFEFWNRKGVNGYYCDTYLDDAGYPCDTVGGFDFYVENLIQTHNLANELGLLTETYIGNPSIGQCNLLSPYVDRILVHYYRKSDVYNNGNSIYNYKKYRLPALAEGTSEVTIIPLFSAKSHFMGPWLLENPMDQALHTYFNGQNGYESVDASWKENVILGGCHWYRYSDLFYYVTQAEQQAAGLQTNIEDQDMINFDLQIDEAELPSVEASVYPTIASTYFHVQSSPNSTIEVIDMNGLIVHQISASKGLDRISCENLGNGLYTVRFMEGREWRFFKVVVSKI